MERLAEHTERTCQGKREIPYPPTHTTVLPTEPFVAGIITEENNINPNVDADVTTEDENSNSIVSGNTAAVNQDSNKGNIRNSNAGEHIEGSDRYDVTKASSSHVTSSVFESGFKDTRVYTKPIRRCKNIRTTELNDGVFECSELIISDDVIVDINDINQTGNLGQTEVSNNDCDEDSEETFDFASRFEVIANSTTACAAEPSNSKDAHSNTEMNVRTAACCNLTINNDENKPPNTNATTDNNELVNQTLENDSSEESTDSDEDSSSVTFFQAYFKSDWNYIEPIPRTDIPRSKPIDIVKGCPFCRRRCADNFKYCMFCLKSFLSFACLKKHEYHHCGLTCGVECENFESQQQLS